MYLVYLVLYVYLVKFVYLSNSHFLFLVGVDTLVDTFDTFDSVKRSVRSSSLGAGEGHGWPALAGGM